MRPYAAGLAQRSQLCSSLTPPVGTAAALQLWQSTAACNYAAAAQPQLADIEPEPAHARPPAHSASEHSGRGPFEQLRFDDPRAAFQSKSTGELMLAYAVFTACQASPFSVMLSWRLAAWVNDGWKARHLRRGTAALQMKPLVENADAVLKWSKRLFSGTVVNAVVKRTFFRHFCAGARWSCIMLPLWDAAKTAAGTSPLPDVSDMHAGESQEDIQPRMRALYEAGIGGILVYGDATSASCMQHEFIAQMQHAAHMRLASSSGMSSIISAC